MKFCYFHTPECRNKLSTYMIFMIKLIQKAKSQVPYLTIVLLNLDLSYYENRVEPDQMTSEGSSVADCSTQDRWHCIVSMSKTH